MKTLVLLTTFILTFSLHAQTIPNNHLLSFIENKGQVTDQYGNTRKDVQFSLTARRGLNIFIGSGIVLYQYSAPSKSCMQHTSKEKFNTVAAGSDGKCEYEMSRLDVVLEGANPYAKVTTDEPQSWAKQPVEHKWLLRTL